jgi:hypothetical protein
MFHGFFLRLAGRRVRSAIGRPRFAMTMSSPAAARLTSRDKLLFALLMFTVVAMPFSD